MSIALRDGRSSEISNIVLRDGRSSQISIRDVLYIIFRQKWKMIIFFLAVFSTVAAVTFLSPNIYRSEARLLVRLGRDSATLDPTMTGTGPVIPVEHSREADTSNVLQTIKSRELVEKVVDTIGLVVFLKAEPKGFKEVILSGETSGKVRHSSTDREKIVHDVMEHLKAEKVQGTNIIHLSYEGPKPELNQDVLTKLINFFLDKHIAVHRSAGSYKFFNKQTEQLRDGLQNMEEKLRKAKNRTGIVSPEDQRHALLTRINDLQKEVEVADSALAASKAKILTLEKTLSDLPKEIVTERTDVNHGVDLMRPRLYDLKLREQDLLSRYTEQSVPVLEIRRQIAEAEALLAKAEASRIQIRKGPNEAYKQVETALISEKGILSSLDAKSVTLKEQLANAKSELKILNENELEILALQREINVQEANYRKYSQNLEQSRIEEALDIEKISNISIVQKPTYELTPVRPRKALNLALALFLGIIGGIGLAFVSEHLDHTIRRPEDVKERLQLPVLAAIPHSSERMEILKRETKMES
jgi:uncharacterized protein involved in exopolysaccharide biosynthesis